MQRAAHQLLFVAVLHHGQVRQVFRFALLCLDVRGAVKLSGGAQQSADKVHTPAPHGARLTQISFLRWPTSLPPTTQSRCQHPALYGGGEQELSELRRHRQPHSRGSVLSQSVT